MDPGACCHFGSRHRGCIDFAHPPSPVLDRSGGRTGLQVYSVPRQTPLVAPGPASLRFGIFALLTRLRPRLSLPG
eukprot:2212427-Lingulodinium_polyedra.AAC.1